MIDLPWSRLEHLADFAEDCTLRNFLDGLQANEARLSHLFHANHVPVIGVAFGTGGDFELVLVIGGVGLGLAHVPLYTAGAKDRAGSSECNAIGSAEDSDVASAPDPDAVAGEEVDVVLDATLEMLAEARDVPLEAVVGLVLQTADPERVGCQAGAAVFLEDFEDFFALAETVEQRRESADVQSVRAEPHKVARDALQFGENGANDLGARRRFGTEKFFDRLAVAQAVADCGDVIHTVDVRSKLLVGPVFGDFFDAAVKIAYDALGATDAFSVKFQLDAQHAMCRRMLRAHVDDKLVGAEKRGVFLCRVFLWQSVPHVSNVLLAALDAEIFPDPSRILPKNIVILAKRMALPLVGKQDAF